MKKYFLSMVVLALLFAVVGCDKVEPLEVDSTDSATWAKTFGSATGNEQGNCVIETSDGNFVACGITTGISPDSLERDVIVDGKNNVYVVKSNSSGAKIWEKAFGGDGDDHGNEVIETSDGGLLVVGEKMVSGFREVYLIKLNASGNKVWEKTYGQARKDCWGLGIAETADGDFIICGQIGIGLDWDDFAIALLIKVDASGGELWRKTYREAGYWHLHFNSIEPADDGGFIICGAMDDDAHADDYFYMVKIDSDGNFEWISSLIYRNASNYSWGFVARQTLDGGYIVSGGADYFGIQGNMAILVVKLNSEGKTQWTRIHGGDFNGWDDEGAYIDLTDDGGYIIASRVGRNTANGNNTSLLLVKIDADGNKLWKKKYNMHRRTWPNWIRTTDDGGFIITGGTGHDRDALFMMKTDSEGNVTGLDAEIVTDEDVASDETIIPKKWTKESKTRKLNRRK